jgi:hypothetical protein
MYRGAVPCPASRETIEAALHENGMLIQLAVGAESFAKIATTCRGCVDPIAWVRRLVQGFVLTVYLLGWHSARRARGCSSGLAHRPDAWNVRHLISAQATMIDTRCPAVNQNQQWQSGQGVKDKCSQSISSCRWMSCICPSCPSLEHLHRLLSKSANPAFAFYLVNKSIIMTAQTLIIDHDISYGCILMPNTIIIPYPPGCLGSERVQWVDATCCISYLEASRSWEQCSHDQEQYSLVDAWRWHFICLPLGSGVSEWTLR